MKTKQLVHVFTAWKSMPSVKDLPVFLKTDSFELKWMTSKEVLQLEIELDEVHGTSEDLIAEVQKDFQKRFPGREDYHIAAMSAEWDITFHFVDWSETQYASDGICEVNDNCTDDIVRTNVSEEEIKAYYA
jgi:hypothetical protein